MSDFQAKGKGGTDKTREEKKKKKKRKKTRKKKRSCCDVRTLVHVINNGCLRNSAPEATNTTQQL